MSVKEFFDQWAIYKKFLDHNYMEHQEFYAEISRQLETRFQGGSFSFLDLGAGDSYYSSQILGHHNVDFYCSLELSDVAIDLAKKNMADITCEQQYICGDFSTDLPQLQQSFDVVLCGFALHHLTTDMKQLFFSDCFQVLKPGGMFLLLDIVLKPDETRADFYQRWTQQAQDNCPALTVIERDAAIEHVTTKDLPETFDMLQKMAIQGGFSAVTSIVRGQRDFYELMVLK